MKNLTTAYIKGHDVRSTMKDNYTPEWVNTNHPRILNPKVFSKKHELVKHYAHLCKLHPSLQNLRELRRVLKARTGSNMTAVERIMRRLLKGIPEFGVVYIEAGRELYMCMASDVVQCDVGPRHISDCNFNYYSGKYISNKERRSFSFNIKCITKTNENSLAVGGNSNTGYEMMGWLNDVPSQLSNVIINGIVFHKTQSRSDGWVLVSDELLSNADAMARWDVTRVLDPIHHLLGRDTTRFLHGQPDVPDGTPTIGVELELDNITDNSSTVRAITDSLRSKLGWRGSVTAVGDGSLGGYGAEFVTGWGDATLVADAVESVMEEFNLRATHSNGEPVHCTPRCGMHIHLSRTYFTSQRHIAHVQWVIERMVFRPVVERVSRRYNTRYCGAGHDLPRYSSPKNGKYRAVNCLHEASIEFRMFAAPEFAGDMHRYKDFVISVVDWMRDEPRYSTVQAYGNWLKTRPQFTALYSFLADLFTPAISDLESQIQAAAQEQVSAALTNLVSTQVGTTSTLADGIATQPARETRASLPPTDRYVLGLIRVDEL